MKIKAIVFDLGKVVFDISFDKVFQHWTRASGKDFSEIKKRFTFNEIFDNFEKDIISADEFRNKISKELNFKISDEEFDKGWCALYLDVYPGIDKLYLN